MECRNCELRQRQFYCENCLRQHILSLRLQTSHVATDRDAHIASAQRALTSAVEPARLRKADLKGTEERVQEIWGAVDDLRRSNESTRERLRALRSSLATRRRTLAVASSTFNHPHPSPNPAAGPPASLSASPPSTYSLTPPGSYPITPSPLSASPQSVRPTAHRRGSSSYSVTSQSPASTTTTTAPTAIPRAAHPFPSPSASPSSRPLLSHVSTSPQMGRVSITSPISSSPHGLSNLRGSAPHASSERGVDVLGRQIEEAKYKLAALSDTLARARSGLVQELVEVFSVVEVGGRPPLGGKAGTKGEWTIGGLVLPVPGDMRRYPPDHINAVITHTLHFLSLLAFYLGIKLPFEVVWSRSSAPPSSSASGSSASGNVKGNGLLGVGTPWVGAIKGGESGGWARWSTKHPLHVSSSNPSSSSSNTNTPSSSPSRPSSHSRSTSSPSVPSGASRPRSGSISSSMADSQFEEPQNTTSAQGSSFTTALAMLLYDVCYLAHTQAVEVPLAQAGEALSNLWAVCCSPELGRKSHATHPLLPPPTPVSFPLDFAQLLQATAANPTRARARGTSGRERRHTEQIVEEDEEGWDFVDASME